jgi:hypothetical protein
VRFVCNIVNAAMGAWGEKYLRELVEIMHKNRGSLTPENKMYYDTIIQKSLIRSIGYTIE